MSSRTTGGAVAMLVLLLLLPGCGNDNDDAPSDDQASDQSTPSDTLTTESEPEEFASPAVPLATGPELMLPNISLRSPTGWTRGANAIQGSRSADAPDYTSGLLVIDLSGLNSTNDEIVKNLRRNSSEWKQRAKRLPDVTVADIPMYRIEGPAGRTYNVQIGAEVNERSVTLQFSLDSDMPAAERNRIIDSVLPTVEVF